MKILLTSLDTPDRCPRLGRLRPWLADHEVDLMVGGGSTRWERSSDSRFAALKRTAWSWGLWPNRPPCFHPVGACAESRYDIVICFDMLLLPDLLEIVEPEKVIVDAREYYPEQFDTRFKWKYTWGRWYARVCQEMLPRVRKVVTVSHGLGGLYKKNFGVDAIVGYSLPDALNVLPTPIGASIKLVHHGNTNNNRSLEIMIEAVGILGPRYSLDLILVPTDLDCFRSLHDLADRYENVAILEPVESSELLLALTAYDIGLFVPRLVTSNLRFALPNKLFEYIQARLMVIATQGSEAGDVVSQLNVGLTSEPSAAGIAQVLNGLSIEQIEKHKRAADLCALSFHSKNYSEQYREVIEMSYSENHEGAESVGGGP